MVLAVWCRNDSRHPGPGGGPAQVRLSLHRVARRRRSPRSRISGSLGRCRRFSANWPFGGLNFGPAGLHISHPRHRARRREFAQPQIPRAVVWAAPDRRCGVPPAAHFGPFRQSQRRDTSEKEKTPTKRELRRRTRRPRPMGTADKRHWGWVGRQASLENATAPRLHEPKSTLSGRAVRVWLVLDDDASEGQMLPGPEGEVQDTYVASVSSVSRD